MKLIRILYYVSFVLIGFFFGWAVWLYFHYWDVLLTSKQQWEIHWKPALGLFISIGLFSYCSDKLKNK